MREGHNVFLAICLMLQCLLEPSLFQLLANLESRIIPVGGALAMMV